MLSLNRSENGAFSSFQWIIHCPQPKWSVPEDVFRHTLLMLCVILKQTNLTYHYFSAGVSASVFQYGFW